MVQAFNHIADVIAAVVVGFLSGIPSIALPDFDLSPLATLLTATKYFLPWQALGISVSQWIMLMMVYGVVFLIRGTIKLLAVLRGAAW